MLKKAKILPMHNVKCIQVNNLISSNDRLPKVECTVLINSQPV